MTTNAPLFLSTLPIELVYRILDNLDILTILFSLRNVCTRLNAITDTYHRYKVSLLCIQILFSRDLSNNVHIQNVPLWTEKSDI